MATKTFCEWRIENFSCWNAAVHGDFISSPQFVLENIEDLRLYPRSSLNGGLVVYAMGQETSCVGNLSFFGPDRILISTKRFLRIGDGLGIYFRLKFEEVAAKVKGGQLSVRVSILSKQECAIAVSTTLMMLNLSLKIDPKSVVSMESDDTKNISIIRYSEKNPLDELLLKAVRKEETVEFVLELLTKTAPGIFVESHWCLKTTDKNFMKDEHNEHLFRECAPWTFSNSSMNELAQNGIAMLLNLKISNGDQIHHEFLNAPQAIPKKETVIFFDQSSMKSEDLATCKKTLDSVTALTKDLMGLYQDQKLSDFQLKCDNVTFLVHKVILSARSPVFDRLLSSDMKEAGEVNIEDMEPSTLSRFLTYLYTGAVGEELQYDSAVNLYYAANKYQVPSLKMACSDFLCSNVCLSNVCDILSLAHKQGDEDLKLVARDFVSEHFNQVLTSKEWGKLVQAEPSLVAETVTSFAEKSSLVKIVP